MIMVGFMTCLGYMSLQASLVICVVLVIRQLFSVAHISKKYIMFLWMLPFFFLVFPWKIENPIGFWSKAPTDYRIESMRENAAAGETGELPVIKMVKGSGESELKTAIKPVPDSADKEKAADGRKDTAIQEEKALGKEDFSGGRWTVFFLAGIVWGAGTLFLFCRSLFSYRRLKRKVLCSIHADNENVCYADDIPVPMVLGYFKPQIYIPSDMQEEHLGYVIAHEKTHIRRKDTITKAVIYFITCIHWFNPLVWLAYYFAVKDMEMACDEETVQAIGIEKKKEYAEVLLQLSTGKGDIFAVPLSFSEGSIKDRIKNVLHYQKTVKIAAAMAVTVGILAAVVFMTEGGNASVSADKISLPAKQEIAAGQEKEEDGENQNADSKEEMQEEQGELTFEMVRSAFAEKKINELTFLDYTNGEEFYFDDNNALNYYINFTYEYEGEEYLLGVSLSKNTDEVEDIDFTRVSDREQVWLYTVEEGKEKYPNDLEKFLSTGKIKIEDWLTLELPKGYVLGSYQGNLGWAGGAYIFPESYKLEEGEGEWTPKERVTSGFVGRILQLDEAFSLKDGRLQEDSYLPRENHASIGETEILDDNSGWQVMMMHWYFDLYTLVQIEEMRQKGIEPEETESEYWYFYFVKEGESEAYYLSLSAKEFSKEEATAIAKTVKMR